jgi:hypothetical protein
VGRAAIVSLLENGSIAGTAPRRRRPSHGNGEESSRGLRESQPGSETAGRRPSNVASTTGITCGTIGRAKQLWAKASMTGAEALRKMAVLTPNRFARDRLEDPCATCRGVLRLQERATRLNSVDEAGRMRIAAAARWFVLVLMKVPNCRGHRSRQHLALHLTRTLGALEEASQCGRK